MFITTNKHLHCIDCVYDVSWKQLQIKNYTFDHNLCKSKPIFKIVSLSYSKESVKTQNDELYSVAATKAKDVTTKLLLSMHCVDVHMLSLSQILLAIISVKNSC